MIKDELKNASKREKRNLIYIVSLIAFALFLVFVIFKYQVLFDLIKFVYSAFAPFLAGLVIAFILNAFVNLFEKRIFSPLNRWFESGKIWNKIRRPLTLVLSYLLVFALIGLIIFFIVPEFLRSCENFVQTASDTVPKYIDMADQLARGFISDNNINIDLQAIYDTVFSGFQWSTILDNVSKVMSSVVPKIVTATVNVASGVFSGILAVIYSVYFLIGKEKLIMTVKRVIYSVFKKNTANRISMVMTLSNNVFSSYVVGQLTECVILGSLCYIGMSIIGLDYALLISVIIMISALIPILGAYIGAALGALILLMVHPLDAVWFLVFIILLQQFEGNVIYPKVVGSSIGLPGLWTLTAIMVCGSMFGILGILIGTPATAVVYRLARFSSYRKLNSKGITNEILEGSEVRQQYADILGTAPPVHPAEPETEEEEEEPEEIRHGFFTALWERIIGWFRSIFHKSKH